MQRRILPGNTVRLHKPAYYLVKAAMQHIMPVALFISLYCSKWLWMNHWIAPFWTLALS